MSAMQGWDYELVETHSLEDVLRKARAMAAVNAEESGEPDPISFRPTVPCFELP